MKRMTNMRVTILLALSLVCLPGCPPMPDGKRPVEPFPLVTPHGTLTDKTIAARATANSILAERLNAIADQVAGGKVKYDSKLRSLIEQALTEASVPLSEVIGSIASDGALADPQCADKIRQVADGYK